jgi:hypothetical protein
MFRILFERGKKCNHDIHSILRFPMMQAKEF